MRMLPLALALSACSYAFVTGPTPGVPEAPCTESYAAPVVDGVLAAGFGAAAVAAFASKSTNTCNPADHNQDFCTSGDSLGPLAGAVLLIPTALLVLSAYHGGSSVGACNDLHSQQPVPAATPSPPPKPWNPDEQ